MINIGLDHAYLNNVNYFEDNDSISSDSGIESGDETRPASSSSVLSHETTAWNDLTLYDDPVNYYAATSFVKHSLFGMLSGDMELAKSSVIFVFNLCRSGYVDLVASCPTNVLTAIKTVFDNFDVSKDVDLMHCISGIFYYLTEQNNFLTLMTNDVGIWMVTTLLSLPLESALYYTVAGLHNLLGNRTLREKLKTNALVTQLLQILWTCYLFDKSFQPPPYSNPFSAFASSTSLSKFLAVLCDCLYLITHRNEMAKSLFHVKQGVIPLLYFTRTYPYEKLQGVCSRLLRILSAHFQTKNNILEADKELSFFPIFVESNSPKVTVNAFWILRNLSDKCLVFVGDNSNAIVDILLLNLQETQHFLETRKYKNALHVDIQEKLTIARCISGTLANFTCQNPEMKSYLVNNQAVVLLSRILQFALTDLAVYCRTLHCCDPLLLDNKRHLPPSFFSINLQATIDLAEAVLRCLTHVTASHSASNLALQQLYNADPHLLTDISDAGGWLNDLFSSFNPTLFQVDQVEIIQIMHLVKAWLSLVRNLVINRPLHSSYNVLISQVAFLHSKMKSSLDSMQTADASRSLKATVESCQNLFLLLGARPPQSS